MMECEGTMHLSCTYCREDAEMDEKRLQSIMDHAVETGELAGCSLLLIKDRTPVCYLEYHIPAVQPVQADHQRGGHVSDRAGKAGPDG